MARPPHQRVVLALLDDPAVLQHDDAVGAVLAVLEVRPRGGAYD